MTRRISRRNRSHTLNEDNKHWYHMDSSQSIIRFGIRHCSIALTTPSSRGAVRCLLNTGRHGLLSSLLAFLLEFQFGVLLAL